MQDTSRSKYALVFIIYSIFNGMKVGKKREENHSCTCLFQKEHEAVWLPERFIKVFVFRNTSKHSECDWERISTENVSEH